MRTLSSTLMKYSLCPCVHYLMAENNLFNSNQDWLKPWLKLIPTASIKRLSSTREVIQKGPQSDGNLCIGGHYYYQDWLSLCQNLQVGQHRIRISSNWNVSYTVMGTTRSWMVMKTVLEYVDDVDKIKMWYARMAPRLSWYPHIKIAENNPGTMTMTCLLKSRKCGSITHQGKCISDKRMVM